MHYFKEIIKFRKGFFEKICWNIHFMKSFWSHRKSRRTPEISAELHVAPGADFIWLNRSLSLLKINICAAPEWITGIMSTVSSTRTGNLSGNMPETEKCISIPQRAKNHIGIARWKKAVSLFSAVKDMVCRRFFIRPIRNNFTPSPCLENFNAVWIWRIPLPLWCMKGCADVRQN